MRSRAGAPPGADAGRRRLLLTAGVLPLLAGGLAACTGGEPPSPTADPDDPDTPVRLAVATDERALLAAYDAALIAHPELADDLTPLREQHAAHLAAVAGPDALTEPPGTPTAAAPGGAAATVRALARAERAAARQRTDACVSATGADLARLLALVGASEAAHATFLRTRVAP